MSTASVEHPRDIEAEKCIIAALITAARENKRAEVGQMISDLLPEDFFCELHVDLWRLLSEAHVEGIPLGDHRALLPRVAGIIAGLKIRTSYGDLLAEYTTHCEFPTDWSVWTYFSNKVKTKAAERKAIEVLSDSLKGIQRGIPLTQVLSDCESGLERISEPRDQWPELAPLERVALPTFPVDALPGELRDWVKAEAIATQTPPDLAALLAMSVCSAVLAKRFEVVSPYREPINLYSCTILGPANRKSAVFAGAIQPLKEIESRLISDRRIDVARGVAEYRKNEKRMLALERKITEGSVKVADLDLIKREYEQLIELLATTTPPCEPRLYFDGTTPEALEAMLSKQGGRMALFGCEGGVFDIMAGRYSKNGGANIDVFLKGHAGDDLRENRLSRGETNGDGIALTVAYAVQPDVVNGITRNKSMSGRGLPARFLWSAPESLVGLRDINSPPVPLEISRAYSDLVERLFKLNPNAEPVGLAIGSEAALVFDKWQLEVERDLGSGGNLEHFKEWGGKLVGQTLRMAGVFHCIEQSTQFEVSREISLSAIEAAIQVACYLIPHAEFVLTSTTTNRSEKTDEEWIVDWFCRNSATSFTRREIQRAQCKRFPVADLIDRPLKELERRGYIRKLRVPRKRGKDSQAFEVNPACSAL